MGNIQKYKPVIYQLRVYQKNTNDALMTDT